jgi:hypothetical protein
MRTCDYCQVPVTRRAILECQQCKKHFCASCFEKRVSPQAFPEMYRRVILCPDCYLKKYGKPGAGAARSTFNKPAPGTPPGRKPR